MAKSKYIKIALFCTIGLMVCSQIIVAQIGPPQIGCIVVDSTGSGAATITWVIPSDTNSTFKYYQINSTTNPKSGYTPGPTISPDSRNSVTIAGIGANAAPVYFSGVTEYLGVSSVNGDTVASIFLSVTNLGGVAALQWNAMHTTNLPGFNGWYKIYREYPQYVWKLLDSTQALKYNDTITLCKPTLTYEIVADNSVLGCQSVSNRVSGQFKDIIAPAIPILDSVSVGPGGNIEITWYPSSSTNAMGYVVYEWKPPLIEIDSIFGRDSTSLSFTGSSPDSASWSFYVSAFDSCGNVSSYSPPQKTIFLKDTSLKCLQENELIWTKYIDFSPGVGKYNIYESLNGHPFTLLASVLDTGINDTTYIQTGLSTPQSLCYYVQVVGAKDSNITASSNKVCYTVTVPPPPKFSYMRSATVITNSTENQVNWYVDTGADAAEYIIERYDSSKDRYDIIGTVAAVANQLNYSFTDPTANPNTDSYIYKVFVKDECNYIIDSTNIGQTIFLTAFGNGTGQNMLAWNDYSKWLKGVSYYNIYRNEDDGPFNLVGSVKYSGNGGTYTDDVSSIITGQGVFGYYIQAVEISPEPTYPFIDSSTSNIAEAYQNPRLYVPNAFNPKGANTIFKPVGVFVDLQNYDFSIYDRWGELLFETTDPTQGWDGTYHGKLVEEGIYIYRIEYTSNTGEFYTQRSWVMMLK